MNERERLDALFEACIAAVARIRSCKASRIPATKILDSAILIETQIRKAEATFGDDTFPETTDESKEGGLTP